MLLEKIQKENDIKQLKPEELEELAEEIRRFLIEKISVTGGHLASNLGVVELTMALHLAFELPQDKMIWDVGHQSYTHKILTGRWSGELKRSRKYGGMKGFPKEKKVHVMRLIPVIVPLLFLQDLDMWQREISEEKIIVSFRSSEMGL